MFLPKFGNLESDIEQSHPGWLGLLASAAESGLGRVGWLKRAGCARWIWGGLGVGFTFRGKLSFLEAVTQCPLLSATVKLSLGSLPVAESD